MTGRTMRHPGYADRHARADERVPGPGDRRPQPDRQHRRQAGEHAGHHRARADAWHQRADDERAEHRSRRQRQHREPRVEHRPLHRLRAQRHADLHHAPEHRRDLRHAHQRRVVRVGADVLHIEIVDRRRRHRVDRRRQRRRDDRRDDEAGRAVAQRMDDEERQDLVVPSERRRQRRLLIERVEHHADEQEQHELGEDDEAAHHEAALRRLERFRREQALHEELIGAVRGERQRHAAEEAGPDRVDRRGLQAEVQHLELVRRAAGFDHRGPAAVDLREQRSEHEQRARDVDEQLHDVGPDHRRDAAAHRVDDHRRAENDDRPVHRRAGHHRDDERRRIEADAVGQRARDQEDRRAQVLHAGTEAALQQLVRRQQFAAEIRGNEQRADDDAADDVAHHQLQERHVAGVGLRGHADERERARFGGDDGAADRPAGHGAIGQEVVARRLLEAREPRAEQRDGDQVAGDDGVVDGGQSHERARSRGR